MHIVSDFDKLSTCHPFRVKSTQLHFNPRFIRYNLFYCLCIAVVILCVALILPQRDFQPQGIFLPTQISNEYQAAKNPPSVLTQYPAHYQTLGNISVMMALHLDLDVQVKKNIDLCIQKAQRLAQEAGATTLLVHKTLHVNPRTGLRATLVYAEALKNFD